MFGLTKRTWIIGGVMVALLGTGALAAKQHMGSPEQRAKHAVERISERMNLNSDQKKAFEEVAKVATDIRGATPEFMLDLSSKLKGLVADKTLTVEEVDVLKNEIKAEFDKRADVIIPQFVAFYNTLDDKQKEMVAERMEKMGDRMEHRAGRMGKHHGGEYGKMRHMGSSPDGDSTQDDEAKPAQ